MILASLAKNLAAGARLALFLPVRPFDYRVSALDYAALVAFNFVLWIAAAAVRSAFQGAFDPAALPVYLASVPLVLATALLVAHAYGAPERLLLIAIALTASDALFEIAGVALPYIAALTGSGASAFFLFFGWMWVVAMRAVVVCGGRRRPQLYQGVLAVSAMIAIALFAFPRTDVWQVADAGGQEVPLAEERLFHLQGELIERALAAIQPGRRGAAEPYFVGFAPDASQEGAMEEIRAMKALFDERFGTKSRSVALASSYDALEDLPVASVTNLGRVLRRIGSAMNPEEDVLVLFIAGHSDAEHRLGAWQPPLELAPLTPTALARMLQDAGIQWRIVAVSGCLAEGYREPLRDRNTVVLTAGCEAGSLGEAFEGAASLAEAVEAAGKRPGTQISVGEAIAAKLKTP